MRDIDIMAATMRRIHDSGPGCAHRLQACPQAFVWLAGRTALDGQAVSDPIADVRLSTLGERITHLSSRGYHSPARSAHLRMPPMADYFCQFSVRARCRVVGVGREGRRHSRRAGRRARPPRRRSAWLRDGDRSRDRAGALWIHADEYGDPEHVTRFVLRCAEAFDLEGVWGFCWSLPARSRASKRSAAAGSSWILRRARRSPASTAPTGSLTT